MNARIEVERDGTALDDVGSGRDLTLTIVADLTGASDPQGSTPAQMSWKQSEAFEHYLITFIPRNAEPTAGAKVTLGLTGKAGSDAGSLATQLTYTIVDQSP